MVQRIRHLGFQARGVVEIVHITDFRVGGLRQPPALIVVVKGRDAVQVDGLRCQAQQVVLRDHVVAAARRERRRHPAAEAVVDEALNSGYTCVPTY